jgi:acyl-CoA synthetase (AMP-forming)/AMP-acid ligase II
MSGSEQALSEPLGSIPAVVERAAQRWASELAVIAGDRTLTFEQLWSAAQQFAAALVGAGLRQGDRVAIWLPNSPEWIVSALGTYTAGLVVVPVNTRYRGGEAAAILNASGARGLVTVGGFLGTNYVELLRAGGVATPALETIIVADDVATPGAVGWQDFVASPTAAAQAEVGHRSRALKGNDVADILFTSGTTGTSKGAVSTHSRSLAMGADWIGMTGLHAGDRYLQINPYFHIFGLQCGILTSLIAGATMLPEPVFDIDRVLDIVEKQRVTVLPGAPTIYQSILDHATTRDRDLSSLRVALTGAAEIPVELIRRINTELPFSRIISAYGMTEVGTASCTLPQDTIEQIATSVGHPRPGFEVRIVAADGTQAPPGEPGEILLRTPTVMLRYLDDPAATAAAISADGWVRTGDAGRFDEDGLLHIVGRIKDMFIVGGFNAYPAEIEGILTRHPGIDSAAVIGIPDARLGEVGMAFVVLRPGPSLAAADVIAWSRDHMANYKVPRVVRFVEDLPRNASGKVQKQSLRAAAGADGTR